MGPFAFNRDPKPRGERGESLPESNPHTAPDSTDPTGVCPRCGEKSSFEVGPSCPVSFGGGYSLAAGGSAPTPRELDRATVLFCRNCNQGVTVIEEQWVGDHPSRDGIGRGGVVTWRGIHWWPPPRSS